ncbi:MAG: hypothetical protein CSA95_02985 [Bacteroidetes bacterium]|nr:MAG: hypothetical protein CSA95_02985 [Bacteroidota bacterium]PIE87766.1 MAG: hypothetical protein CSA04_05315 [Bacteroidota bacterium]
MKKIYLVLVMLVAVAFSSNAQNSSYPWVVGTGVNFVDFMTPQLTVSAKLSETTWEGLVKGYPAHINVSRYLFKGFSLTLDFNTLYIPELDGDGNDNLAKYLPNSAYITRLNNSDKWAVIRTRTEGLHVGSGRMYYGHLSLQYNFFNVFHEKRLKTEKRKFIDVFDPYIVAGMGMTSMYEDNQESSVFLSQQTGVGFNIWAHKNVGIFGEGVYTYLFERDDFMSYKFGVKFRFGKDKDIDKDGVHNKKDACPEEPGPRKLKGCPDSDNDGIPDKDDKCPEEAGLLEYEGCNDSDGDGVADYKDDCPEVKGLKDLVGCPDSDGDGVADKDDDCPDVPGTKAFKGCVDSDGDGVPDNLDKCPDVKGLKEFDGCMDTDGDGIPDNLDECPEEAGIKSLAGCPKITAEEIDSIFNYHAKHVYFDTDKATIKEVSYKNLDKILELLNEYPDVRLTLEGHADIRGTHKYNQSLSEDRAFSVLKYFTDRGVSASRFKTNGFSYDRPAATNKTIEGRAKNRRTELHIIVEK